MHILVVDDTGFVQQMLIHIVRYAGYDAVGCADGLGALHHLHTYGEYPSLIFLDVMMPKMDGWEVLDEIRNYPQFASIPIVMISGSGYYKGKALAYGAVDFIEKPFDIDLVQSIIKRYCAVYRVASPLAIDSIQR